MYFNEMQNAFLLNKQRRNILPQKSVDTVSVDTVFT